MVSPIGEVRWRQQVVVRGRVRSMRITHANNGGGTLELVVVDETGGLTAMFAGRTELPGVDLGTTVELRGRAGTLRRYLALLNPTIEILVPE